MATPADSGTRFVKPNMTLFQEFRLFLDKYGVVGLAIAFVIGAALTQLVQALVADLLMPTLAPALSMFGDDWRTIEGRVGPFGPYLIGHFLYAVINFFVIASFVFVAVKYVLREDPTVKR